MAVVGNLLGGWSIRKFNLNVRKTMCVAITGFVLTTILLVILLLLGCDPNSETSNYTRTNERWRINFQTNYLVILYFLWFSKLCSSKCDCGDEDNPVCDVITNITYRSACHAGCTAVKSWKGSQVKYFLRKNSVKTLTLRKSIYYRPTLSILSHGTNTQTVLATQAQL